MNDSEFLHGLGLGLSATGISAQPKVAALCLLADSETFVEGWSGWSDVP